MANKLTSILQSGTNNYLSPSLSFNRIGTDFVTPGVVGAVTNTSGVAPATGSFAVNAQGSPNMSVAVNLGQAYVNATPTGGTAQTLGVTMDAAENVTIASNASGSTVFDFIYLKLDADKLNNPAVTGLDVTSLIVQRSTSVASDSNGAASNAILLAIVTVANAAASIGNGNIADVRINADPLDIDGWLGANETWTYSSATAITVPAGAPGKYSVGDKIRLVQSGAVKYFYIVGVAATTLTITGGSDYTLVNAAILQPCYSHAASPVGFPQWFTFAPALTGFSVNPVGNYRFNVIGRQCTVDFTNSATGTSNSVNFTAVAPITSANLANTYWGTAVWFAADNSVALTTPGRAWMVGNTTTINIGRTSAADGNWTATGGKQATFTLIYEI